MLEGGHVVVAQHDPAGEARARANIGGMESITAFHHAVHDLLKQAADNHMFALAVIAGHEGAHHAARSHAAQEAALLHQRHLHALPGSRDGRRHAGGAAADDNHIISPIVADTLQFKLRHAFSSSARLRTLSLRTR